MGLTFDFGQLVMDDDFAGMIKHTVQGIPVNDDTLSVDIIHEIGPFGEFVSHENTYKHMRITSRPKLIDRMRRDDWMSKGASDMYQRATEEARHILESHKPPRLPESVVSEIQGIIRETEEELGIPASGIEIIGHLTPLEIRVSNVEVRPVVGVSYKKPSFKPNPEEVDYIIEVNIKDLLNPNIIEKKVEVIRGIEIGMPYYNIRDNHIWGATAMILSEFLDVLENIDIRKF